VSESIEKNTDEDKKVQKE